MRSLKVLILLLLSFIPFTRMSAQAPLSDKAFISLLTCGPGDELYSVFGHTAIRVSDQSQGLDIVYNYGTFDFAAPNFYLKFVKGDLQYFVSVSSYDDFVYTYKYYDRDVYEQVLNLTPEQEQKIFDELNDVLRSDRKFYTYKFINRNCTTMAGDVIELGTGQAISKENSDQGKTHRKIIYEYLENHFIENLGISLMFGAKTDEKMTDLFLPKQLMEGVDNSNILNKTLAQPAVTINKSLAESNDNSLFNNYYFFWVIVLALMIFSHKKYVYVPYLTLAGLIGLFFCVVGSYSFHDEVAYNYNALLINPLFLLLLFFIYKKHYMAIKYTVIALSGFVLAYIIIMVTKPHFVLVLPLIALTITILTRILLLHKPVEARKDNI